MDNNKYAFKADAEIITTALEKFYKESKNNTGQVINQQPMYQIIKDLGLSDLINNANLTSKHLQIFIEKYLQFSTRLHQSSYMAHQVSVPYYAGALGSLIDGFTNNAMAIYEMGPAASSIEYFMINWMLEMIGWKPSPIDSVEMVKEKSFGGGVLTHGGSLANLTVMIAARSKVAPNAWHDGNPGNLAILAPKESHYSISRAAGILGIGQNSIYHLEVNKNGAIIPDKIPEKYNELLKDGKIPIALVANGCSTAVGIFDPIDEIGNFCDKNNIWFHIDGAHGASILLSQKHKHFIKGIEKADSVTWDTHKMMRVPTLCAALLVKDYKTLDKAFQQDASYLFHEKEQPGFDFLHRTVECTKAGLGLKFFMVVAAMGKNGLEEYIDRQIDTTIDAYNFIQSQSEFSCPVKPEFNILCFRVEGTDDLQLQIRDKLIADGEFYISTTIFNNKRYLRLSVMNPDTSIVDIKNLISKIRTIKK